MIVFMTHIGGNMERMDSKQQFEEEMVLTPKVITPQMSIVQVTAGGDILILIQITIIILNSRYITLNNPDPLILIEPINTLVPITIHIKIYILVL